jgi:lambda repressor-like predicted transcriptional regulator
LLVETVRRYSKQPHLWSLSKRLARWLEPKVTDTEIEPTFSLPHIHKLSQRLSEETVAALVRDYKGGTSLAELQRTYSLGRGSVQKVLKERGVRRRRKGLTEAEIATLVRRYEAGLSIREIAVEQGLAKTTVQNALARMKFAKRPAVRR